VEGAGAASLVLFGRPVAELSVPQLMTLAVIPQNPRGRRFAASTSQSAGALDDARCRLWVRWLQIHPADARFSGAIAAPVQAGSPEKLPFLAPHFTDSVLRQAAGDVRTTLDLRGQIAVERMLQSYVREQSAIGIHNAGALLLEVTGDGTAETRAYVGSADYRDAAIDGQVNAVAAKRSPGSALKPFVYALALDQGLLHPRSILKDAPSSFGPFSPENFDGRFLGPIAAEDALIRSRNVPAVAVASQLAHPNLYDFLKASGVSRLNSEHHYGLALALGGGEVSMEELARMYAVLLNGGRVPEIRSIDSRTALARTPGEQLLSSEASFITLDMLGKNPRPDTGQPASPAVAWKTGTSWGFHDAWSVGVFGRFVLVVWVGNFDNTANPAFVGVQAAAPLLFRIVDALRSQGLDRGGLTMPAPRNIARIEVCAASGELPNADCPQTVATWYIPGKSPIRVSELHRRVYVDANGRGACGPGPGIHQETYEFWSSDMLRLFREAGMPRRAPPAMPDCATAMPGDERDAPHIVSPLRGVAYTLRLRSLQPLTLSANVGARTRATYWFAGKAFLGRVERGESLSWLPPQAGRYSLRAVDDDGAADARDIDIEILP
jgi:penicillin-binding protein 1C